MHRSSFNEPERRYRTGSVHGLSGIATTVNSPGKHTAILISGSTSEFTVVITGITFDGAMGITGIDTLTTDEYSTDQNQFYIQISANEDIFLELEIVSIISSGGSANTTITFLS